MKTGARIAFVCEFGGDKGWGHVTRCVALAQEALRRGWSTALASASSFDSLPQEYLAAFSSTRSVVGDAVDIVYVDDMYSTDDYFYKLKLQWHENGAVVFAASDDMQRRSMEAVDLVINSELGLVGDCYPKAGKALLGAQYAPLRAGFASPKVVDLDPRGGIPIFIMLGGTDPQGMTKQVLKALGDDGHQHFYPIVVANDSLHVDLSATLDSFPGYRLLSRLDSSEIAGWMQACEAAVIACGSSVYELAALRVPFVGISVADNQRALATQLKMGWGVPVIDGETGTLDQEEFLAALRLLDGLSDQRIGDADLLGSQRVINEIDAIRSSRLL